MSSGNNKIVKELLESDVFLKLLAEKTSEGILVAEATTFIYANKAMSDMLEYSQKEMLNISFEKFVTEEFHKELYKRIATGVTGTLQIQVVTKSKKVIDVEYTSALITLNKTDYRVALIRQLFSSEKSNLNEYWNSIIANSTDVISVIDKDFKFISINNVPNAAKKQGNTKANVVGVDIFALLPESQHQIIKDSVERIKKTRKSTSFIMDSKSGNIYKNTYVPTFNRENFTGFIGFSTDITEEYKNNKLLRASEAKYKSLIENAPEIIMVLDVDTRKFSEVSGQAIDFFGYSRDELLQMGVFDISAEFNDEGVSQYDFFAQNILAYEKGDILQNGKSISMDWIHLNKSGDRISSEVRLMILPDNHKRLIRASVYDTSEKKNLENLIVKLSQKMSKKTGEEFLHETSKLLSDVLAAEHTFIGLLDDSTKNVETISYCHNGKLKNNFSYELIDTPCQDVLKNKICSHTSRVTELYPKDKMLLDMNVEAYLGIPLTNVNGEVIGLIATLYKNKINNIKYYEAIIQLFSSRVSVEMDRINIKIDLIESEEKFKSVFESSKDLIMLIDVEGKIIDINWVNSGYDKSSVIGSKIYDWFEDHEEVIVAKKAINNVFENNKADSYSTRIVDKTNNKDSIFYISTVSPIIRNNQTKVAIVSSSDVTEQKNYELFLKKALSEVSDLKSQLELENTYLKEEIQLTKNFDNIIYKSDKFKEVLTKVEQVGVTDSTVLVLGETGTGKELIARAIHAISERKDKTLVKVNCATLSKDLIESELFGHEKGAFTGAINKKLGKFELANRGTIFLDEIGELSLDLQVKLLRVLQEGEIDRVGGSETIKIDVRVIVATNKSLKEEVALGNFRSDLFYRLNVFPITLPALRDRKEDISLIASFFLEKFSKQMKKENLAISEGSITRMRAYDWPGNVRELENVIERAVVRSQGGKLIIENLLDTDNDNVEVNSLVDMSIQNTLFEIEKNHIIDILESSNWKIQGNDGAATKLSIAPSTLRDKIRRLGIKKKQKHENS